MTARYDTVEHYLTTLASAAPTPGGGSAAALIGAFGAALCAMVARITAEGKAIGDNAPLAERIVREADRLRAALYADRASDEAAYGAVVAAMALPKGTADEKAARTAQLQAALAVAAAAPLDVARRSLEVMRLAGRTIELENQNLVSDTLCAAEFAAAAIAASAANVRINHRFLKDRALISSQTITLEAIEREARALVERIRFECGGLLIAPAS